MTKLEQKLIQLGYCKKEEYGCIEYWKESNPVQPLIYGYKITILISDEIIGNVYTGTARYYKQIEIDNLQQAYNQLQKDLEVLKEYE